MAVRVGAGHAHRGTARREALRMVQGEGRADPVAIPHRSGACTARRATTVWMGLGVARRARRLGCRPGGQVTAGSPFRSGTISPPRLLIRSVHIPASGRLTPDHEEPPMRYALVLVAATTSPKFRMARGMSVFPFPSPPAL